ncbi:MAG: hypothetical protein FI717_08435 [SAR202 cluster bacterium]|nr:hypothetical protein [Chloroflexota bacterium]MQF95525.1 hypothetical protein [SAR202 cluster bacterium]HAA94987.1 hypothetical protein [Dehalococcoidia bacterium]MBO19890.1 hypothetical protein [Chloroflexota bacterium]MQG34317.1 hypothetical protein [SAR202 cluster bacterium]|tara:strand:+ start:247 stop:480 length:234 start_codon:yes stop_codon:yes gene_type:complete
MVVLAIVLGAVIGGIVAVAGTLVVRGDLGFRPPRALDPEYRHHEVVTCGELMAIGMKAGSVGSGAGAVIGFLVWLVF